MNGREAGDSGVVEMKNNKSLIVRLMLLTLFLGGCDLLLGADSSSKNGERTRWESNVITTGVISGLDAGVSGTGGVAVSYVHEESNLRMSTLLDGEWTHHDGSLVIGPASTEHTHLAAGPTGEFSVLYYSTSELHIASLGATLDTRYSLNTMELDVLRGNRPGSWHHESADLAYDSDGLLRAFARDVDGEQLWLFRETATGWVLDVLASSTSVTGPIDMVVAGNGEEHVLFSTGSAGWYYFWNGSEYRWRERLQIGDSPPLHLRLREDESSVLAWRDLNEIQVAEEYFDELDGRYLWLARPVVNSENLFWHNMDIVLDSNGYPNLVYILGPFRGVYFEVWFAHILEDGSWERSKVVDNLNLDSFNPFDVKMVLEPTGRIHIILRSGSSGGDPTFEHRLLDIYSDEAIGNR